MSVSEVVKKKAVATKLPSRAHSDPDYQIYLKESNRVLITEISHTLKKRVTTTRLVKLKDSLRFLCKPHVEVASHLAKFFITFELNADVLKRTRFFVRWGSYDDIPEHWVDVKVKPTEIIENDDGTCTICKIFAAERRGHYGATLYATNRSKTQVIWQGNGNKDDAKFWIDSDSEELQRRVLETRERSCRKAGRVLFKQLVNYEDFEESQRKCISNGCSHDLSRILFQRSRKVKKLRNLLSEYHDRAETRYHESCEEQGCGGTSCLRHILSNLGVGEVVFVSPEGPHAMLGGLARVMQGLLESFSQNGVPVTLISPLYEFEQGSKHRSAEQILRDGIELNGQTFTVTRAGEIDIPFGPTYAQGTPHWVQQAHEVKVTVYTAEVGNIRLVLLRHERYANCLYADVYPDEQLRRSIFLSRGALEVIKNPLFGIHPQLIISNDWHSALVPVFHKLDLRYSANENLRDSRTIHIIHNCGRDYHGLIPAQYDKQDLYPMLELEAFHFGGLADPHLANMMNLTAGAICHLNGALLAVSKPYAQQLLSWEGGEGLNHLLESQKSAVFGISNGVDQKGLRKTVIQIGEQARAELGKSSLEGQNGCKDPYVAHLPQYKQATKLLLQRKLGLEQNGDKVLVSLVGRVAEQKGIQLLSDCGEGEGICAMESILCRYPEVQFVVAGPTVKGDKVSERFRALVERLSWKYGGRVAGLYDFVAHQFAIEIFTASDLYLMPSRYEPGGITQLEALACGAVVIARDVGGLSATLRGVDRVADGENSFLFDDFSSTALRNTVCWAIESMRNEERRLELIRNGASSQHDWNDRVPQYLSVFQYINGVLDEGNHYQHLADRAAMIDDLRA
ncbi:glycogen/starch synthase [Oligoflexia bacterium]|nr:glycogen/starch synthase [Oligoflexia bacterium]